MFVLMKAVIRDLETGLFLKDQGVWSRQNEAMEFVNSLAAWRFCVSRKILNVDIHLFFSDPGVKDPLEESIPWDLRPQAAT